MAENGDVWAKVDEFKSKADEFYSQWQRLRNMRQAAARDPESLKEWNELMGEAEGVTAKVSDVEQAINDAKSWAGSFFGIDEYKANMRELGTLGLAPIVIALIAGAIAWISTWLTKAYTLDRKLTYQENLIAQGVSPERAASTASEESGGFFEQIGSGIGNAVALAGLAAVLLYFFFEKKRGF